MGCLKCKRFRYIVKTQTTWWLYRKWKELLIKRWKVNELSINSCPWCGQRLLSPGPFRSQIISGGLPIIWHEVCAQQYDASQQPTSIVTKVGVKPKKRRTYIWAFLEDSSKTVEEARAELKAAGHKILQEKEQNGIHAFKIYDYTYDVK